MLCTIDWLISIRKENVVCSISVKCCGLWQVGFLWHLSNHGICREESEGERNKFTSLKIICSQIWPRILKVVLFTLFLLNSSNYINLNIYFKT